MLLLFLFPTLGLSSFDTYAFILIAAARSLFYLSAAFVVVAFGGTFADTFPSRLTSPGDTLAMTSFTSVLLFNFTLVQRG